MIWHRFQPATEQSRWASGHVPCKGPNPVKLPNLPSSSQTPHETPQALRPLLAPQLLDLHDLGLHGTHCRAASAGRLVGVQPLPWAQAFRPSNTGKITKTTLAVRCIEDRCRWSAPGPVLAVALECPPEEAQPKAKTPVQLSFALGPFRSSLCSLESPISSPKSQRPEPFKSGADLVFRR